MESDFVCVRTDKTVSAMRVLKNGKVAVARSYTAKCDLRKFDIDNGTKRALSRLNCFVQEFRRNSRRTRYETVYGHGQNTAPGHVLFEIVELKKLHAEERGTLRRGLKKVTSEA